MRIMESFAAALIVICLTIGAVNTFFPDAVRDFVQSERQRIEGSIINAKSN